MSDVRKLFTAKALKKQVEKDVKILGPCCAHKDQRIAELEQPIKSKCGCTATHEKKIKHCNRHSTQHVRELEADRDRLRGALEKIRDFPKKDYPRRTKDGYPEEIEYDEFAYRRMVDVYREIADAALAPQNPKDGE